MANQDLQQQMDKSIHSGKKKDLRKQLILVFGLILFLVILAIVLWLLLRPRSEPNNFIVTEENKDIIESELQKSVAEGMFEVRMNTVWEFETSDSPSSNAYIANAEANLYTVYFDITIDSTNELVFTSPYIPVGSKLQNLTLEKKLEAGTYPATVTYHLVDEEGTELSDVAVVVTLKILQ